MILAQLPTGVPLALMIGATLCVALMALFLVLAFARAATSSSELEAFREQIAHIVDTEIAEDRKAKDIVDPKTWTGFWFHLMEATGRTPSSVEQPSRLVAIIAIILAAVGFLIFPGGIVGLLVMPVGGVFLMMGLFKAEAKKRNTTLNKQLPLLISGLQANIMASMTPQNALISVADDIPSPLGDELKLMKQELEVNVPVDVALDHLAERVPSRDIKFLVAAVKIAAKSGSDLGPQLGIINNIIVSRTRLQQKLSAAISSVSPTIWVSALIIPAMFIFQYASSPENRDFWFTPMGIGALIACGFLYAVGLFISNKMVKGVENA